MATPRSENFDEFAHSSREMSKKALLRVLVLYDPRPIWVLLDANFVSYTIRLASRPPIYLRQ